MGPAPNLHYNASLLAGAVRAGVSVHLLMPFSSPQVAYDALFAAGSAALSAGLPDTDAYLRAPHTDTRLGLTVLVPVRGPAAMAIAQVQAELRALEPDLYFYPAPDLHVTLISLLTARPGWVPDPAVSRAYQTLLTRLLGAMPPLGLSFRGLTLTAGAVMAQGYPDAAFQPLREVLRAQAVAQGLPLDERYHSPTAHATIVRFPTAPRQPAALTRWVAARRALPLGEELITELHLVAHDWYNRQAHRQLLARLPLRGS